MLYQEKLKSPYHEFLIHIGLIIIIFVSFLIPIYKGWDNKAGQYQLMMQLCIAGLVVAYILLLSRTGFRWETLVYLVIFIGIVMRVGYMLYTPATVRGHDIGALGDNESGHFQYINIIYSTGRLPQSNSKQFYQPPLYHMLAAICMKLVNFLTDIGNPNRLIEASKIVSCVASCAVLRVVYLLGKEFRIKDEASVIMMSIVSFLPNMYLLAGRVNNDSLTVYFIACIILLTIRWYKKPCWYHSILLALAYGLGMMTKLSCGLLAIFTGCLMLISLWKAIKDGKAKQRFTQLLLFGCISFPLGLWYPIRNKILFNQAFNYVVTAGGPTSRQYVGDIAWSQRFLGISWNQLVSSPYNHPYDDYNCAVYLIKGALFGEFEFSINSLIPRILLVTNIVLIVLSLWAIITQFLSECRKGWKIQKNRTLKENIRNIDEKYLKIGLPIIWLIILISYFTFNIKYPYGCTMDFRYVVPTAIIGAILLGYEMQYLRQKIPNDHNAGNYKVIACYFYRHATRLAVIFFSILSIVMFVNIDS